MKQVQLLDDCPECLATVFHCEGFAGSIVVPDEFKQELHSAVDFVVPIAQTLQRLPNPNIIHRVVLISGSTVSDTNGLSSLTSEPVRRVSGKWTLFVPVPGPSGDMRVELETAWSRLLQLAFPIEDYLFKQSYRIDPVALQYLDADNMWIALVRNLIGDPVSAVKLTFPATPFVVTQALRASLETDDESTASAERKMKWEKVLDKLEEILREPARQSLLQCISTCPSDKPDQREIATKLALHLFDSELLEKITDVRSLDFTAEPLGDIVLKRLKYLKNLESLTLDNTFFNSEAMTDLRWLQRLRFLSVKRTNVVDSGIYFLSQCPGLEELDCSDTRITGSSIKHFAEFKRLKRLNVSGTRISEESLKSLLSIKGLEVIATQ
jgi:hypothetical protein